MSKFQRIKKNITRCTFLPEKNTSLSDKSFFIESKYMSGEIVASCPMEIVDVSFEKRDIYRYITDGKPEVKVQKTVDGQRTYIANLVRQFDRLAYRAKMTFKLAEDECIYGLGQDEDGVFNKRGHLEYLYHHNMKIPMPIFISNKNYAVLFNCGCLMKFDDRGENTEITLECVEQLDFFVITGSMDEIVAGYRLLTGSASPMPEWVFGYMQSKEHYKTQFELVEIAKKYRELNVPIDVIIQDWKSWVGDLWGDKILDKERYPDVKKATDELKKLDIHTLVSVWPNMNSGGENHAEFAEKGMLLNDYSTYDAFDENARRVYWEQAERELYNGGFDGWWCDSTEPFTAPDWGGEVKMVEDERYLVVGGEHEKYIDPEAANLFALMHAKGMYENQPNKPVVNLTRSGYAGIQKYGVILWAGDTSAKWEELRKDITKGISISLCGIPYWTIDTGAFFVGGTSCWRKWKGDDNAAPVWFWRGDYDEGVHDKGYQELYTRWLQFACFLPVFRSHGTDTPREVWNFEPPFYDAIVQAIKLRYRLMPYILQMAKRVTEENFTIMRSLLFDFPNDENSKNIDNQYMFGNDIMVCPIYKPFYYTSGNIKLPDAHNTWECYLPKGADWYDFWSRAYYKGGQTVKISVCPEHIPIFVRAGTKLPTQHGLQSTAESKTAPIVFEDYPLIKY